MVTRLVNLARTRKYDVYIGRPSIWGNRFTHICDSLAEVVVGSREEAVLAYEQWIMTQPQLLALIPTLKGKVLGCWCAPYLCHGEVLIRLAESSVPPLG